MNDESYPWNIPGIKQRLAELRADLTLTCEVIGSMLSAEYNATITKNSVIGKSRRMNLERRDPQEFRAGVQKIRERKVTKHRVFIAAPIEPKLPPRTDGAVTIYQLGSGDCRFPLSALNDYPPFMYCGREQNGRSSYCADHFKITHGGQR
jgi:GcrA cell cycle regulator